MLVSVSFFWLVIGVTTISVSVIIGIALFLLHNYGGLKLCVDRDVHITDKAIEELARKYPKVSRKFIQAPKSVQLIENNQEIMDHDKTISELKNILKDIQSRLDKE